MKCRYVLQEDAQAEPDSHPEGGPVVLSRNPTTSFLTATTLIYAIGAGITAAAGLLHHPPLDYLMYRDRWTLCPSGVSDTSLFTQTPCSGGYGLSLKRLPY